jgi:hypothetical protein
MSQCTSSNPIVIHIIFPFFIVSFSLNRVLPYTKNYVIKRDSVLSLVGSLSQKNEQLRLQWKQLNLQNSRNLPLCHLSGTGVQVQDWKLPLHVAGQATIIVNKIRKTVGARLVAGFCLTSPFVCVTVSLAAAVPHLAVIIRLILSLGIADGQRGCVSRVGARESVRDA